MENKLGKEELIVLCAITPETGTNEKIAKKIKVKENIVEKALEKLEGMKLVSRIKTGEKDNVDFWSTTREGENYLSNNTLINEYGEFFTKEEVKEISDRILRLPDELIDELFFRCKLIYMEHDLNQALPDEGIEDIREEKNQSQFFLEFINETPKEDILKNLKDIEEAKIQR